MPMFTFETAGFALQRQTTTAELPDVPAARLEAVHTFGQAMRDDAAHLVRGDEVTMVVRDGEGRCVYVLTATAACGDG